MFGGAVADQRAAFIVESLEHDLVDRPFSQLRSLMKAPDQRAAQEPQIVAMPAQGLPDRPRLSRWRKNGLKHSTIARPGATSRSSYIQLVGH